MPELILIDISEHQGAIDWDKIEQAYRSKGGLGGVIMRVGYGTSDGLRRDGQFDRNRQQARQRGIPRMYYAYAYPGRSVGPVQARGMAALIGQLEPGESLALDIEDDVTFGRRLVVSDVEWCRQFCQQLVDIYGVKPFIYMNSNVLGRYDWAPLVNMGCPLWLANYGPNNGRPNTPPTSQEWPAWAMWQYTSRGTMAGISPVDMNIFQGDQARLLSFGKGGAQTPPPVVLASHTTTGGNGTSYILQRSVPGYVSSIDAASTRNSNSTVPPGTYYVFNQARGMVNITRTPGVPGWWINPGNNVAVAPTPQAAAPSGNFSVTRDIPGFYTAANAANRTQKVTTVRKGSYFVYNTHHGMVNVTNTPGVPGAWINPADNHGAFQTIPAPQTHTVVKGDSVDKISRQYGLSVTNNYAHYRSLNPNSGHGGDWTNIWPGDVVRVR